MTGSHRPGDPEIVRLREEIAADLLALRQVIGRRSGSPGSETPIADQLTRLLRGNPAWAAAAAAGVLAGMMLAVRNRLRGASPEPRDPGVSPPE